MNKIQAPEAAYIHIPFCRRRCYYCDFAISVVGDKLRGENSGTIQEYMQFLCQEIYQSSHLGKPLTTIFFGGGTPSLLAGKQLELILSTLEKKFGISPAAEISMEIDPGTFDLIQLREYQNIGINRFSLGVQAFQDNLLALAGRSHDRADIFQAINIIHQAQCSNWSLDLISGLPQQTLRDWQASLEIAVEAAPNHISCYDLIVENTTPFAKQYQPGIKPLPDDEITATMYRLAQEILTQAGYDHYEVSNYAQVGKQCRHNRVYWQGEAYYGFGMGAASYAAGKRFTRPRTRNTYYQWINAGCEIDAPLLEVDGQFLETLMLGLRLQEGLEINLLVVKFGCKLAKWTVDNLKIYQQQGWVEFVDRRGKLLTNFQKNSIDNSQQNPNIFPDNLERVRLNDPEGFLFSNTILANLFNLKDELDRKNQSGELD